ncbi:Uncharacterised protein [Mycobacteroides abscessus subsp. abscessus]|nr:Uncharacterised protein [Mycobacteroides abscessus subsp. abscessus]
MATTPGCRGSSAALTTGQADSIGNPLARSIAAIAWDSQTSSRGRP